MPVPALVSSLKAQTLRLRRQTFVFLVEIKSSTIYVKNLSLTQLDNYSLYETDEWQTFEVKCFYIIVNPKSKYVLWGNVMSNNIINSKVFFTTENYCKTQNSWKL